MQRYLLPSRKTSKITIHIYVSQSACFCIFAYIFIYAMNMHRFKIHLIHPRRSKANMHKLSARFLVKVLKMKELVVSSCIFRFNSVLYTVYTVRSRSFYIKYIGCDFFRNANFKNADTATVFNLLIIFRRMFL